MGSGATVDGYLPYVGVRSDGSNTSQKSFGGALLYVPQQDRIVFHVVDNGVLKYENKEALLSPKKDTWYQVELKFTKDNHVEFRIWEEGTTKPETASAKFDNSGSVYTPVSVGNKFILSFFHGSGAPNTVSVFVDDFSVTGKETAILQSLDIESNSEPIDDVSKHELPSYWENHPNN